MNEKGRATPFSLELLKSLEKSAKSQSAESYGRHALAGGLVGAASGAAIGTLKGHGDGVLAARKATLARKARGFVDLSDAHFDRRVLRNQMANEAIIKGHVGRGAGKGALLGAATGIAGGLLMAKMSSEMTGGRYLEAVPTVPLADTEQVPVVSPKAAKCLEKVAATALSKRVNGKMKSRNLHTESDFGKDHVPSSTLNQSVGGKGRVDPLSVPLKDRLAQRKSEISLNAARGSGGKTLGESNPFSNGTGKADQIHNAKVLRNAGPTGISRVGDNVAGRANAADIGSALRDSRAGHQTSLRFDGAGNTSFSSMAPPPKPGPQSLGARILSKIQNGAGSAAAHLRAKAGTFLRSPLGKKVGIGAGVVGAGLLASKVMGKSNDDEQQYYNQGYGL